MRHMREGIAQGDQPPPIAGTAPEINVCCHGREAGDEVRLPFLLSRLCAFLSHHNHPLLSGWDYTFMHCDHGQMNRALAVCRKALRLNLSRKPRQQPPMLCAMLCALHTSLIQHSSCIGSLGYSDACMWGCHLAGEVHGARV